MAHTTHVFTAGSREGGDLLWTGVTIDHGRDPKGALDRITMPQEVLDRVALTTLPRSSIIISDEPLSSETNYRTEFVAILRDQPQGGFITREPTDDIFGEDELSSFASRDWDALDTKLPPRGRQSDRQRQRGLW